MWRPCATARRDDRAAVGWAWTGRNLILDEALLAAASSSVRWLSAELPSLLSPSSDGTLVSGSRLPGGSVATADARSDHSCPSACRAVAGARVLGVVNDCGAGCCRTLALVWVDGGAAWGISIIRMLCHSWRTPWVATSERAVLACVDVPVSRARSSPVPGVVAYFRPSYAAGQK